MRRALHKAARALVAVTAALVAPAAVAGDIDFSGQVKLDKRLHIEQEGTQAPIYHQALLNLAAYPTDQIEVKLGTKLRFYDFALYEGIDGLGDPTQGFPLDVLLWESYVDVYDLIEDRLDLRVGKQRIAWGTADKFNPTDNLNPDDLSDFLDFGAKVPSWAVQANLLFDGEYLKRLTLVWLPGPVPAMMPRYGDSLFASEIDQSFGGAAPPGITTAVGQVDLGMPPADLEHSMQAVKIWGGLQGVDWTVSYFHGFDDIPIERTAEIQLESLSEVVIDASVSLPEIHVLGLDFAGELFSVGWWLEAGIFFPEEVTLTVSAPLPGGVETREAVALHDDPYTKLTAGADYTFFWGTYVNLQYVHGLFAERGGDLHDYFIGALRQPLIEGQLQLTFGAVLETDAFEDLEDNFGVSLSSELAWKPFDNIDFYFGHVLIGGRGNALFATMPDGDQTYVKMRVSF